MITWALSIILGIMALSLLPVFLSLAAKVLTKIGKKHPDLADVGAIISFVIIILFFAAILYVLIIMFHYLLAGHM